MQIVPFGDRAVRLIFGDRIDPAVQLKIGRFMQVLAQYPFPGYIEDVPAYTNLVVYYDPLTVIRHGEVGVAAQEQVRSYLFSVQNQINDEEEAAAEKQTVRIPVCYGGSYGPDLKEVAEFHHLSVDEVIARHSAPHYLVYMLGFAPGFPFLGGLSEALETPRRAEPRLKIAAGSVGIAGKQTGAYPLDSPGGWQIIGRTPVPLFRPKSDPPTLLSAGDLVQFDPVSEEEYQEIRERAPWH
ncbi:5-oxoprolinase subunit PxpB [Sporolactobacillus vineae]|uniref:5-oxoprolinase subunit PxpB n=1 Tax=Sporolactobacillus vineae TaxID=444463 RepID=UPI0002895FB9|nr:5-oxoprolinase subunit PxpB [Sporolactobacillus vineae]